MIIYKLDRKHHFYTQYKSHLLGWKLQPLRNLSKQLYKNINIFIFTGCQSFIPWQLSEKALQIIESMVADNKKYILIQILPDFPGKECLLRLFFTSHPVQVMNETFKHQEAGLLWEISSPTVFYFGQSLVSGGNAFHFSYLLSDMICEGVGLPLCLPPKYIFQVKIPGPVKWSFQCPRQ